MDELSSWFTVSSLELRPSSGESSKNDLESSQALDPVKEVDVVCRTY